MTLPDPANDRDEPTDEEVRACLAETDCEEELALLVDLVTDAEILKWAHAFKQQIHDAVNLHRENQNSDGDE